MDDEYAAQEHGDGKADRLDRRQPWCTGKVGMIGISWGGFNALQIAARRPPALEAIVTICSTDDRYADDMHYMGGCLLTDTLDWGSSFFARMPRPPDPEIVGRRWREMWQAAPGAVRPAARRRGSPTSARRLLEARLGQRGLCGDPLPGLRRRRLDGRLLERHPAAARAPEGSAARADRRRGGTVSAHRPSRARPSASCRSACAGSTTGSRASTPGSCASRCCAPLCRRRCRRPATIRSARGAGSPSRCGRRRAIRRRRLHLNAGGASGARRGPGPVALTHRSAQTVGSQAASGAPTGSAAWPAVPDRPARGRRRSLVFDTAPLADRWTSWAAGGQLALAVDKPVAFVAVRLNDVFPDGACPA